MTTKNSRTENRVLDSWLLIQITKTVGLPNLAGFGPKVKRDTTKSCKIRREESVT